MKRMFMVDPDNFLRLWDSGVVADVSFCEGDCPLIVVACCKGDASGICSPPIEEDDGDFPPLFFFFLLELPPGFWLPGFHMAISLYYFWVRSERW